MSFTLNPSNQAIALAEFNDMGDEFVRCFKTANATFQGYIYERIGLKNLIDLLDNLKPQVTTFIKGMRLIPTLTANDTMRFIYVPCIMEEINAFGSYRIFENNTSSDVFYLLGNSSCYWAIDDNFTLLNGGDLSIAKEDYQRYLDEILISHDGSGDKFEAFDSNYDTTSVFSNLPGFSALADDNKYNGELPEYFYILSCAGKSDGKIVQSFSVGVYKPGTIKGNSQGAEPFTNKALNRLVLCPYDCKKIVTVKNRLALP